MCSVRLRFLYFLALVALFAIASGCAGEAKPDTPVETFKAYVKAIKEKNTTEMKSLLSSESIKMHQDEAKAQNVTLDDIVKRETLFSEGQRVVEFRNEKIEGERATLEVKNAFGAWETVPFIREDSEWKIDKKGYTERLLQDIDQNNKEMDDFINQGKQPPLL